MKITKAASKALSTGILSNIFRRSFGGHICQEGFIQCCNGKILKVYIDQSEPVENQITHAKIVRISWNEAMMDAVNS